MIRRNIRNGLKTILKLSEPATNCVDEPSTSNATPSCPSKTVNGSFTDIVKSRYPQKLEVLNRKIIEHHQMMMVGEPWAFRDDILKHLSSTVLRQCRFVLIGSSVTGISGVVGRSNDLDLCVYPTNQQSRVKFINDFFRNGDFRRYFMMTLSDLIRREISELGEEVEDLLMLCDNKVPVMIYRLKNGLKLDIQFPNTNFHAIRNSNLVKMYCSLDPRMSQLYMWLNSLCEAMEIKYSKLGLLSSYHLTCLLIHFLQSEQVLSPWPVLPILCKTEANLVSNEVPIDKIVSNLDNAVAPIEWKSNNNMSVAELAVRFIDYYSYYDATSFAISIKKGTTVRRRQKHIDPPMLLLFDPYARESVCNHQYISSALSEAMYFVKRKFKAGEMIESFPIFPERDAFRSETEFSTWRVKRNERLEHLKSTGRNIENASEIPEIEEGQQQQHVQ